MDWKKLFSEPATLGLLAFGGVVGFFVGIINGIIQKRHGGWSGFFTAWLTTIIVAIIVNLILSDYIKSEAFRIAVVASCALIADDIRLGLLALGQGMRTDPLGTVVRIFDALRGRPSSTPKE